MTLDDALPQSDQIEGAPHPNDTPQVFGHDALRSKILSGFSENHLHHAIFLCGTKGIGKATFAWQIAGEILTKGSRQERDGDQGARARIALGHPDLLLIRRAYDEKTKKFKQNIGVDEIRGLKKFFALAATDKSWRVAIIDSVDEMSLSAANAILKILEEPPERTIFLLVTHHPSRLLPTILSRGVKLNFQPLDFDAFQSALHQIDAIAEDQTRALFDLSSGSVGRAVELRQFDGPEVYQALLETFSKGEIDRTRALAFAEKALGAKNQNLYAMMIDLIERLLAKIARASVHQGASDPSKSLEEQTIGRLLARQPSPKAWAKAAIEIPSTARQARAVLLDPASVILDMLIAFDHVKS